MKVSLEKPGTPQELVHVGVKGMRWGVRKERSSLGQPHKGMSTKKKVAIGVGVAAVAVGAAATVYYLHKNGKLPLSSIAKGGGKVYQNLDAVPKKIHVSEIEKARRAVNREQYIKLMMSSKKFAPSLAEATRIANETYPLL